jgi:hypothetical protein
MLIGVKILSLKDAPPNVPIFELDYPLSMRKMPISLALTVYSSSENRSFYMQIGIAKLASQKGVVGKKIKPFHYRWSAKPTTN